VVTFQSEGSIGAGVRRVEALVGSDAYAFLAKEHLLVTRLTELTKAPADQLIERVSATITALKDAERDLAKARSASLASNLASIIGEGKDIGPLRFWAFAAPSGTSAQDLRELVMQARGRQRDDIPAIIVGTALEEGKVSIVTGANQKAIDLGADASAALKAALPAVEGRGGGKPDFAQGGGTKIQGIDEAFLAVEALLRERVGS
jgi:alanyl-tRNA synthetase